MTDLGKSAQGQRIILLGGQFLGIGDDQLLFAPGRNGEDPGLELIARLLKRGETSGRSDDNLETIQKRLQVYEVKTAPVNDFYKQTGKLQPINGMGTVEEIFDRVSAVLESKK